MKRQRKSKQPAKRTSGANSKKRSSRLSRSRAGKSALARRRARTLKTLRQSRRTKTPSPRQVAVRAQETAFQLITTLDRGGLVPGFLRRYASERSRLGRIADAGRFRELAESIRREAFLVLALQIESDAAQRFPVKRSSIVKIGSSEFDLSKLFREEFYISLGRALGYSHEEFAEFCRDLDVYRTLRESAQVRRRSARTLDSPKGPFVDRCGFLLDSAMLEQARQAAAKFELELQASASAVLRKVFSRRAGV